LEDRNEFLIIAELNMKNKTNWSNTTISILLIHRQVIKLTLQEEKTALYEKIQILSESFGNDTVLSPFSSASHHAIKIYSDYDDFQYTLTNSNIYLSIILSNAINSIYSDKNRQDEKVDNSEGRAKSNKHLSFNRLASKELSVLLLRSLGYYNVPAKSAGYITFIRISPRCTYFSDPKRAYTIRTIDPKLDIPLEHWDRPCSDNTRSRSESPALAPVITNGFRCKQFRSVSD
jgi:hypothetical protein